MDGEIIAWGGSSSIRTLKAKKRIEISTVRLTFFLIFYLNIYTYYILYVICMNACRTARNVWHYFRVSFIHCLLCTGKPSEKNENKSSATTDDGCSADPAECASRTRLKCRFTERKKKNVYKENKHYLNKFIARFVRNPCGAKTSCIIGCRFLFFSLLNFRFFRLPVLLIFVVLITRPLRAL